MQLRDLFLTSRLFLALCGVVMLFVAGHFWPLLVGAGQTALAALAALALLDAWLLFGPQTAVTATRDLPDRLSNGDENPVTIIMHHGYSFPLHATIHDELPVQLQARDAAWQQTVAPGQQLALPYTVRPTSRGAYAFGAVLVYAASPLGLVERRYRFEVAQTVPVYPSFLQMRRYALLAASNRLEEVGVKRVRRLGHTMEFDHIREYVVGDDHRTVNWKASARRGGLMVNQYQDERAQPVYALLDMGRVMQMPFEGLSLLDYSINASLVLANIALMKQDRAGLVAFSAGIHATVAAARRGGQIARFQETLYALKTDFAESDYERLVVHLERTVRQRSLLLLFTNFETRASMQRQLPYLKVLARRHVVVAVFFENTELKALLEAPAKTTEAIYTQTIAQKYAHEKRETVAELNRHGIRALLTAPQALSVNTINTYLALKAQGIV